MRLSSVLLVVKERHAAASEAAASMEHRLAEDGARVTRQPSGLASAALREAARGADATLVLGGDGTVLETARALAGLAVPILGINFGRVGFLAEVQADAWESALDDLCRGAFHVQSHIALRWRVLRDGTPLAEGWAVNDVVAARGQVARAISLELSVNGVFLSRLRCDGLIVSAPLGATAYAASAHGPLAIPSLRSQIVTPISPFAGAFPPLVLPDTMPVRLVVGAEGADAHLTVDGQIHLPLLPGDDVLVDGTPDQVLLLTRDANWYLRRLVERGFILPGPGSYKQSSGVSHAGI